MSSLLPVPSALYVGLLDAMRYSGDGITWQAVSADDTRIQHTPSGGR